MEHDDVWSRIKVELAHWTRKTWSFADVGAHWDATEDYDSINEETYSYFRRFVDGLKLSDIPVGSQILDICARTGKGTEYFYNHGKVNRAVCADMSLRMGEICRNRLKKAGIDSFMWIPISDYHLPIADNSFDAVLCFETVEHVAHPQILIKELGRLTRKNGVLILTTPNVLWEPIHALAAVTKYHHSEGPHRFVRMKKLRQMVVSAGFEIEQERTTVLVPGGPEFLVRLGEWVEQRTEKTLMPLVGLRRIIICRKL